MYVYLCTACTIVGAACISEYVYACLPPAPPFPSKGRVLSPVLGRIKQSCGFSSFARGSQGRCEHERTDVMSMMSGARMRDTAPLMHCHISAARKFCARATRARAFAPHHPFPPQLRHFCAAYGVAQPGRDSVSRGCKSRRELERQVIRMTGVRARDAAALAKRASVDALQYRDRTPVPHIAAQTWPNSLAPCN